MAALPEMPDSEALRRAIIAKLGIDPTKLTAFGGNPEFDANVTNLYRGTTQKYGDLDLAQARAGSDYETALAQMQANQKRDLTSLDNSLADRGLLDSGAAVAQRARLGEEYGNKTQALNLNKTRTLEDVDRQRNEALNSLLSGRATYEGEYANNLSTWLQQQAQAAASVAPAATVAKPTAAKPPAAAVQRRATAPVVVAAKPAVKPVVKPVVTAHGPGYKTGSGNVML